MLDDVWHYILWAIGVLDTFIILTFIPWIILTKKDTTAAVAWSLIVLFLPLFGGALWIFMGYNWALRRRIKKRQAQRELFGSRIPSPSPALTAGLDEDEEDELGHVARQVGSFGVVPGNAVGLLHKTTFAFESMLTAFEQATHHIHLEFFIIRNDGTGRKLIDALARKAAQGVEVRLLYDGVGCFWTSRKLYEPLVKAGGKVSPFMSVSWVWTPFQINLRNHRKVVVIDGRVAFAGGMNIGDEYLGKSPEFGYWRDSFVRVEGPAAASLQRTFVVDWAFACNEELHTEAYFPPTPPVGPHNVQVVEAGPDQTHPAIRDIFFAAIVEAQERVWISTPYFVPDSGLLDALRLARRRGVDVRIVWLKKYDKRVPFYAAFYYWPELLKLGVRVFQYKKGMMHAKVMIVDQDWAMVSSANFDNRSLHLSFEAGCIVFDRDLIDDLSGQFEVDVAYSEELELQAVEKRPWGLRLEENAYRLLSPLL